MMETDDPKVFFFNILLTSVLEHSLNLLKEAIILLKSQII